jgi:hypothetical protein
MKKIIIFIATIVFLFAQNYANLKITNETIAIYGQVKLTENNIYARGEYLYNDDDNKENFLYIGLKGEGNLIGADIQNIKLSLLLDLVHTKNNSAIPIGISVFSYLPNFELPIFIRAEAEYAPKVLSFDNADKFSKVDAVIGIQPIENAEIFMGYRNISFNNNYDNSFYGGIGYYF